MSSVLLRTVSENERLSIPAPKSKTTVVSNGAVESFTTTAACCAAVFATETVATPFWSETKLPEKDMNVLTSAVPILSVSLIASRSSFNSVIKTTSLSSRVAATSP